MRLAGRKASSGEEGAVYHEIWGMLSSGAWNSVQ